MILKLCIVDNISMGFILFVLLSFAQMFSITAYAEIIFPFPNVQHNEAEFKQKTLEAKKETLEKVFVQFTKDYNQQFKTDNNMITQDVISAEIMKANISQITKGSKQELDQPIEVHTENIKSTYDYIAKQFYEYELTVQKSNPSPAAPNFRNLEIVFAVLIILLAGILYFMTYKKLRMGEHKENGFSVVEVLVALGLLSIVGVGTSTMVFNMMSSNNYVTMGNAALNLRTELTSILSDDRAWVNTINDTTVNPDASSAFGCLRTSTACAAGVYPFTPKLVNNTLFRATYDPQTLAARGFNANGAICNTYSAAVPNDSCPVRYTFTWQPICPAAGPCIRPQIRIRLIFNFSATNKYAQLNPERYGNDNIVLGNQASMYSESSCILMGGAWNSATQVCTPAKVIITCVRSSYSCIPEATCATLSGGSTPTCGAYDGVNCTCSAFITQCTANGSCTCPPINPTMTGNSFVPTSPVSPSAYSVQTVCQ